MKIVNYIGSNGKRFAKLMDLFFSDEYRVTQRASWAVRLCADGQPELIKPWLKKMIMNLTKPDLHAAVKRNTLKILTGIDIPEKFLGICVDVCFNFLRSKDEPVAVKVFAMTVLSNSCAKHPDLKKEIKILIGDLLLFGKPGIIARGKKILKELEKV